MTLNLPHFNPDLRVSPDGQREIFDCLRDKFVALTPEEWVRQHFVNFLVRHRGYNPNFMANEVGLKVFGTSRRCDTVIYDRFVAPVAVVEYKAPSVAVTAKVFDQIVRYNMTLRVRWLMVSNGLRHFCCEVSPGDGTYRFVKDIPRYEAIIADSRCSSSADDNFTSSLPL